MFDEKTWCKIKQLPVGSVFRWRGEKHGGRIVEADQYIVRYAPNWEGPSVRATVKPTPSRSIQDCAPGAEVVWVMGGEVEALIVDGKRKYPKPGVDLCKLVAGLRQHKHYVTLVFSDGRPDYKVP